MLGLAEILPLSRVPSSLRGSDGHIWVWLKMKQEGQTAGFGPCFHLPGQPILEFRFFEPQPFELSKPVHSIRIQHLNNF